MELTKRHSVYTKSLKNLVQNSKISFDSTKCFGERFPQIHLLDEAPSDTVELTKEMGLKIYKNMHLIYETGKAIAALNKKKSTRGFCHIGQESVAVGVESVLRPQDTITTFYRCHQWEILKSGNLARIFAQLLGKGHLYSKFLFGNNGIPEVSLGIGVALSHQYLKSGAVSVTACDDGRLLHGYESAALNFAKLHNLPLIVLIENNVCGMDTRGPPCHLCYKSQACIPGIRADGMQVLAVMQAAKFALKHVTDGKGPIILEAITYRDPGYSMSSTVTRSTDDNMQKVRDEYDCLKHLAKLLTNSNLSTVEELNNIRTVNKDKITKAQEEAKKGMPLDCYTHYAGEIKLNQPLTEVVYENKN